MKATYEKQRQKLFSPFVGSYVLRTFLLPIPHAWDVHLFYRMICAFVVCCLHNIIPLGLSLNSKTLASLRSLYQTFSKLRFFFMKGLYLGECQNMIKCK